MAVVSGSRGEVNIGNKCKSVTHLYKVKCGKNPDYLPSSN
jgi:hypothetical protein